MWKYAGVQNGLIRGIESSITHFGITSECPFAKGLMSRKEKTFSVSMSLKEGISPFIILQKMQEAREVDMSDK